MSVAENIPRFCLNALRWFAFSLGAFICWFEPEYPEFQSSFLERENVMAERLVDILGSNGLVIHTYPVTLGESGEAATDEDFQAKALEAAAHGQLVPAAELSGLTARMHHSRGGRMEPYGDEISSSSETKLSLDQAVRERAHALWEQAGRPEGRADEFWNLALDKHLRERAYVRWQQEGSPEGGADEDWESTRKFQSE
ncbi:DUF2934 domain-containing protein [Loktanella sp. DJP18]|uniref:DUF2934 domain-containing protein n=1 Tax=Loktanella sp. DJP18 TaxID=3409788 RepID=UPI003BB60DFE